MTSTDKTVSKNLHSWLQGQAGDTLCQTVAFLFPIFITIIHHGGSTLFFSLLTLTLLLWSFDLPHFERNEKILFIGLLFIILTSCLSLINGENISRGVKNIGKLQYFLLFIPIYICLKKRMTDIVTPFIYGIATAGPVMAASSIYQVYFNNHHRASGAYNQLVFGYIGIIFTFILFNAILTKTYSNKIKIVFLISGIEILYSCVLSGTRGALMILPFIIFFQIIMLNVTRKRKLLYSLILAFFITGSISASYFSDGMIKKRINVTIKDLHNFYDGSNHDTSLAYRFLLWDASIKIWKESPFIGTGLGDFRYDIERMIKNNETTISKSWKHAHNYYLEYLATTGIIGFSVIFFSMIIFPFWMFMKKWNDNRSIKNNVEAICGMSTILAFSMVGFTWYWPGRSPMVITYVFCLLVFMPACHKNTNETLQNEF